MYLVAANFIIQRGAEKTEMTSNLLFLMYNCLWSNLTLSQVGTNLKLKIVQRQFSNPSSFFESAEIVTLMNESCI